MDIEAGARVLANYLRYNYDDMREGYLNKEFKPIIYTTIGGITFQGHKEDIKILIAKIVEAVATGEVNANGSD